MLSVWCFAQPSTMVAAAAGSLGQRHVSFLRRAKSPCPVLVQVEPVADEELEGYRTWLKESSAGPPDSAAEPSTKRWWQFWN